MIFWRILNDKLHSIDDIEKLGFDISNPSYIPDDYLERLSECKRCPNLKIKHMRCGLCGCLIQHKAKWKTTDCPDKPGRWKKILKRNDKK